MCTRVALFAEEEEEKERGLIIPNEVWRRRDGNRHREALRSRGPKNKKKSPRAAAIERAGGQRSSYVGRPRDLSIEIAASLSLSLTYRVSKKTLTTEWRVSDLSKWIFTRKKPNVKADTL